MTQVKMPDPVILRTVMPNDYRYGHVYGYTRTHMEAYADARVREALEKAAAEAKRVSDKYGYGYYGSEVDAVDEVGEAIRALLPPTE